MTPEIIIETIKSGGVVGLLALGIYYFFKKEKYYKQEIEKLQTERKEERRELVVLLFKVGAFMENGDKNLKDLKEFISQEFKISRINGEK